MACKKLCEANNLVTTAAAAATGAQKLCVLDGPLYPHANGLVFVSRPTKVHVLLLHQVCSAQA
jgi:hypothetical protein